MKRQTKTLTHKVPLLVKPRSNSKKIHKMGSRLSCQAIMIPHANSVQLQKLQILKVNFISEKRRQSKKKLSESVCISSKSNFLTSKSLEKSEVATPKLLTPAKAKVATRSSPQNSPTKSSQNNKPSIPTKTTQNNKLSEENNKKRKKTDKDEEDVDDEPGKKKKKYASYLLPFFPSSLVKRSSKT